jgi:hypothetical protein
MDVLAQDATLGRALTPKARFSVSESRACSTTTRRPTFGNRTACYGFARCPDVPVTSRGNDVAPEKRGKGGWFVLARYGSGPVTSRSRATRRAE